MCPGSFDPLTNGHVDVINRARTLFDEVIVGVAVNSAKTPLLSLASRLEIIEETFDGVAGVRAVPIEGLLADFCRTVGADALVKGLRGGADLDAELPMALMNRHLAGIETAFILGDQSLSHIASSLVKDVIRHGGTISDLVPPVAETKVREALAARADASERRPT